MERMRILVIFNINIAMMKPVINVEHKKKKTLSNVLYKSGLGSRDSEHPTPTPTPTPTPIIF